MESGMDQHNDNNSLRQDIQELKRRIQELERRIEEKDEELRQYRKQETKTTLQMVQATKELSDYIATRAQEDLDRLQQVEETHRNEMEQLRDAQARETSLLQPAGAPQSIVSGPGEGT
ncbi:hypothetical protein E4U24_002993 [Claviceps purpurea]|nr:hypothetical protein E4U24_002993 [Claviceps purpurea]KAG6260186.1 hypothetical protein E4U48_008508 [Claviceps purpurea]